MNLAMRSWLVRIIEPQSSRRHVRHYPVCLLFARPGRVRLKPMVDFGRRRQNDRHALRVDRRDDRVGLRRQEAKQFMLAFGRSSARAGHARASISPRRRRAACPPSVRIMSASCGAWCRHTRKTMSRARCTGFASVKVPDVGHRRSVVLGRPRHSPASHYEFALVIRADADDRRELVARRQTQRSGNISTTTRCRNSSS